MLGEDASRRADVSESGDLKAEERPDIHAAVCPIHWVEPRLAYAVIDEDERPVNVYHCERCDGFWPREDLL